MIETLSTGKEAFRALALQHVGQRGNEPQPYTVVSRQLPADLDTPVSALLKIRQGEVSFLLESVERGNQVGRYSFLGTGPTQVLSARDGRCTIKPTDGAAPASAGRRRGTGCWE